MKKVYKQRIVDKLLARKLAGKGAILIEGAKWCGKTTTAEQIANSVLYMSETGKIEQNKQLAIINPKLLLQGARPRLIDEWQLAPTLWDSIRFEADHADELGLYILTGSSVPADMSDVFHTGTGRFGWLKMRPMSLWESEESSGDVSLKSLERQIELIVVDEVVLMAALKFDILKPLDGILATESKAAVVLRELCELQL